jgi:hypothetical protein
MKQADKTSRRVPEERAATREEVVTAVEAITPRELRRLERYARRRIFGLRRAARGRDWEDLLREAVADTYEGSRRWNKESVDFSRHLIGAMRSISSHWRDQFDPGEAFSESEVTHVSPEGKLTNPMLEAASPAADPERELEAKQEVERIGGIASKNPLAWLIMDGWRGGMTGPEIREALEVSQKDYETALKWLRRNVRPKTDKEGRDD